MQLVLMKFVFGKSPITSPGARSLFSRSKPWYIDKAWVVVSSVNHVSLLTLLVNASGSYLSGNWPSCAVADLVMILLGTADPLGGLRLVSDPLGGNVCGGQRLRR